MDSSTKAILVKLKISPEQWDNFVKKTRADLDKLSGAALTSHLAKMQRAKDEIAGAAKLNAEEQKQIATAQKQATLDKAAAAAQRTITESVRAKTAAAILATAEARKQAVEAQNLSKLEQAQLSIKKQQLQIAQQQVRLAQQQQAATKGGAAGGGAAHGGGGILGGVTTALAGMMGGGLLGQIAGGAAAGELLAKAMEMAAEKIKELGHELLEAAGPAGQLREQFEKLTARAGADPEEFLNKLRVATRGLVEDNTQLIKVANQFMAGPLKLQPEQIEKLTGLTIALARANGKDATQAIQALSRAAITGRVQMLGFITGIDRASMSAKGMGGAIRGVAQEQLQLGMIMDAMTRRFAEVGTPMTTVKELFSQIHMVQGAFIEDMAYSMTHSLSFANAIQTVSKWISSVTPMILNFASTLGEKLGDAFYAVSMGAKSALEIFHLIEAALSPVSIAIQKAHAAFDDFFGIKPEDNGWKEFLANMALGFIDVGYNAEKAAINIRTGVKVIREGAVGDFAAIKQTLANGKKEIDALNVQLFKDIEANTKFRLGDDKLEPGKAGPTSPTPPDPGIQKQIQKLKLQLAKETAKELLNIKLEEIDAEKAANKDAYESGLEAEADYLKKEHQLREAALQVKLQQIESDRKAQLAELAFEAQGTKNPETGQMIGSMDPQVKALRTAVINKQAADQASAAKRSSAKEDLAITKEGLADELAARREYISAVNKINQEGVQERLKQNEEEFKSGSITPVDFEDNARALYAEQRNLANEAAQQLYDASKKNEQDLAKLRLTGLEDEVTYQKQITELVEKEGDRRLEYLDTKYNLAKKFLETEATLQTGEKTGTGVEEEQALQNITEQHIRDLIAAQRELGPLTAENANDWLKVADQINSSREELVKLNEELFKAKDISAPLGELFGSIAKDLGTSLPKGWQQMLTGLSQTLKEMSATMQKAAGSGGNPMRQAVSDIGAVFHKTTHKPSDAVKTAQQIFETAQQKSAKVIDNFKSSVDTARTRMIDFAQAASQAIQIIQNGGNGNQSPSSIASDFKPFSQAGGTASSDDTAAPQGDIFGTVPGHTNAGDSAEGAASALGSLDKLGKSADQASDSLSSKLPKAINGIVTLAQSVMSTVSTIMNAKTAGSGAVGGLVSGGKTGMQIGSLAGPMGAAVGAGVGAVFGGVMGGIVGAKRQAVEQDITKVKAQLQGILDSLNAGTLTLGDAINTLRKERQAAIQLLGNDKSGKKDPSSATGAIQAIDQEIQKLVDEQQQVLDDMTQQIQELSQPTAFQPIVQQLDDIIKKYQQFASAAAGNTMEVAQAQQYLNLALQQYATTISQQLQQANQQAVQDALNLLNLEQQRYDLIQNEAKQEYDIMTSGVLTRQRGTAATKGAEIAQLRYQRDQQLIQMNEEISVAQEKVAAETKMFGLASDRINLEKQLLILQEQQSDLQMTNILALQQTLSAVNGGIASGNLPTAIQSNGTLSTGSQLLNQILGMLGLNTSTVPIGAPGTTNYLGEIPQQWQGAAQFMNGIYPNFLHFLIEGLQGSGQAKQTAENQASGAKKELVASGYDFNGFLKFIQTGSLPASDPVPPAVPSPDGTIPTYATGTPYVPVTGPAILHQGEAVIPAAQNLASMSTGAPSGMGDQYKMLDITNARAAIEMQIVAARSQLLQQEIAHMNNVQDLLSSVRKAGAPGTGVNSLEGAMQKVYELRGRYGSGGFTRQNI